MTYNFPDRVGRRDRGRPGKSDGGRQEPAYLDGIHGVDPELNQLGQAAFNGSGCGTS